jgi:hypothetical protein
MDLPRIRFTPDEPKHITPAGWWALRIVGVICLTIIVYQVLNKSSWGASVKANVVVEFVVTDRKTGRPIPGAVIDVTSDSNGRYGEPKEIQFVSGSDGRVRSTPVRVLGDETVRFYITTSSYANSLEWVYQVSAAGYESTEPEALWDKPKRKTGSYSYIQTVSVLMDRK